MLIHIGRHKTGTTWLQRHVFNNPKMGFSLPFDRRELYHHLIEPHSFFYDVQKVKEWIDEQITNKAIPGTVPVISAERLSGNPHAGCYDSEVIAVRLKEIFPDAKFLFVFREQKSMIVSTYKQYVRVGGHLPFQKYIDGPQYGRARLPHFNLEQFRYDAFVEHYRRIFGAESILAMPYELLKTDPEGFLNDIYRFMAMNRKGNFEVKKDRENQALNGMELKVRKLFNRLFMEDAINPAPIFKLSFKKRMYALYVYEKVLRPVVKSKAADKLINGPLESELNDYYSSSNQKLNNLVPYDLKSLNYSL